MLIRDKVGEEIQETIKKHKQSEVSLIKLNSNEEFFQALIEKIQDELDLLTITKAPEHLAEIYELIDWVQISLGITGVNDIIEKRKDKLGLYWNRYYLKEEEKEE